MNTDLGDILFGGVGADRYLVVAPAQDRSGTTTSQLHARYQDQTATREVTFIVTPRNTAPTLSVLPAAIDLVCGQRRTVGFEVHDQQETDVPVTLTVLPVQFSAAVECRGVGSERTLALTAPTDKAGTFTVAIVGIDQGGLFTSWTVTVNVVNLRPHIERAAGQIVVTWPDVPSLHLEISDDLSKPWNRADSDSSSIPGEYRSAQPSDTPSRFFRIRAD